jgi:hypothetical protein
MAFPRLYGRGKEKRTKELEYDLNNLTIIMILLDYI